MDGQQNRSGGERICRLKFLKFSKITVKIYKIVKMATRSKKASTAYLKTGSVSIANPEIRVSNIKKAQTNNACLSLKKV